MGTAARWSGGRAPSIEAAAAEKALREAQFYGLEGLERLIIASTSLVAGLQGGQEGGLDHAWIWGRASSLMKFANHKIWLG